MGLFGGDFDNRTSEEKERTRNMAFKVRKKISGKAESLRDRTREEFAMNDSTETLKERAFRKEMIRREEAQHRAMIQSGRVGNAARASRQVGFEAGRAASVAMRQPVSFSREQQMLGEMFGQGDKIWGNVGEPVRINNDLNSSRSDYWDETSSMFGWGPHRERSGMF